MYQKCPICEGSGNIVNFKGKITKDSICPTCNGKRIIHTQSGLPPRPVVMTIQTQGNENNNGANFRSYRNYNSTMIYGPESEDN
jgi:DnaJ-class molecular chaperone